MYDIIFISYQEPNAEKNWNILKERFPRAKRVQNVKGIHQAHIAASKKSFTKMFWVVDGDAQILPEFNFEYSTAYKNIDNETVYVCRSKNPVNGLIYGYGGVKLLPKRLTSNMSLETVDMTIGISKKFIPLPEVSNLTVFNTDPFNTWKSAFRECAKLSSKIIDRQNNEIANMRLNIWCTAGKDKPFGEYAISGANAGKEYGEDDNSDISLINDFEWLHEQFSKYTLE